MSELLARAAGIQAHEAREIGLASRLHDLGKIAIPDAVLKKSGALSTAEEEVMKGHCYVGSWLLSESVSPLLSLAGEISLTHHENFDGSGYPEGLKGDEIPLSGRVVHLCDVFDSLLRDRPFRRAESFVTAVGYLMEQRGKQFDPELVDLFFENIGELTSSETDASRAR